MKKTRFTEAQIVAILQEADANGVAVKDGLGLELGLDPIPLTLKNWTPKVQKGVSTWPTRRSSGRKQSVFIG